MSENAKVVVNLATGLEDDAERVTVAFLVANAALEQGRKVAMFLTKDAVLLGLAGTAEGKRDEARSERPGVAGAIPLWEWIGEGSTVFSY